MAPWSRLNTWVVIFIYYRKPVFFFYFSNTNKIHCCSVQARCGAHIGSMTAQKQRGIQGNYWTMYPCTTHKQRTHAACMQKRTPP